MSTQAPSPSAAIARRTGLVWRTVTEKRTSWARSRASTAADQNPASARKTISPAAPAGVAVGRALLVVAVDLADSGVGINGQRAVPGSGACLPRPGQRGLGEPVQLADVAEGERAQEGPDGGGGHHPVAKHAGAGPRAQHLDVVDTVPTGNQAVDHSQDLAARSGGTGS